MNRVAVIDIGTNSVRLDIREKKDSVWNPVLREKEIILLGRSVFTQQTIDDRAIEALFSALDRFVALCRTSEVSRTIAVATSALREAKNRDTIIAEISRRFGFEVEVISGLREATLIAHGVLTDERSESDVIALVDIGGGSTEVSYCTGRSVSNSVSLPLGALRLQQLFLKEIPPRTKSERSLPVDPVMALRKHVQDVIRTELDPAQSDVPKTLIVTGGTGKAVAQLFTPQLSLPALIPIAELSALIRKMIPLNREELLALPGMEERRVEVILAGALILEQFAIHLKVPSFLVSDRTLRDGIFAEI